MTERLEQLYQERRLRSLGHLIFGEGGKKCMIAVYKVTKMMDKLMQNLGSPGPIVLGLKGTQCT